MNNELSGGVASLQTMNAPGKRALYWAEVVRRLKLFQTPAQIAGIMGMSPYTIRAWIKDPRFVEFAQSMDYTLHEGIDIGLVDDLQRAIEDTAPRAFERLCEILDFSDDERLRASTAQDLLDRAGYGKVQKVQAAVAVKLHPETTQLLSAALSEARQIRQDFGVQPSEPQLDTQPSEAIVAPKASASRNDLVEVRVDGQ